MSLWPKNKPLNQAAHYGRVGAQQLPARVSAAEHGAAKAVRDSQIDRERQTLKYGARATVRQR